MMYFVKTPKVIQRLFPKIIWRKNHDNEIYLTFDDGPIPEITPWILDILKSKNAKATFFCVGENVVKYPNIYKRILNEGHSVGNHTNNHLSAIKNDSKVYLDNVLKAESFIDSKLFRPPYGKLLSSHYQALQKNDFTIVMWDLLSGDFDATKTAEWSLANVKKHMRPGSIIVLHDNLKTIEKVKLILPQILDEIEIQGLIAAPLTL